MRRKNGMVANLTREQLADLLDRCGLEEAFAAAAELRGGAEFEHDEFDPISGEHFAKIYRRRATHVKRIGLDARGLDPAVERFDRAPEIAAFAWVTTTERKYLAFLNATECVAVVSVPI